MSRTHAPSLALRTQGTIAVLLAVALSAGHSRALGQTLSWNNAAGGSAAAAGNWSPAQVPAAANPLTFSLNAAYPVSFSATTPSSSAMTFVRGTVTLTMTSPHTTGNVNLGAATTGNATLTTGTWNTGNILVGPGVGAAGTLAVNSADAFLNCSQLTVAGNTALACAVNVTGAGRISPTGVVIAQTDPTGTGNITVSGQTLAPIQRSTIDCSGSTTVGSRGTGTLTVSAGALYSTAGSMDVGLFNTSGTPSSGTVTVGGSGSIFPATLNVGADLRIGRGSVPASDTGNGTLTLNGGGSVNITGATTVGGSGLGSGLLQVSGGQLTTHGLSFGSTGDFQHSAGTVTVIGGPFIATQSPLTVSGASNPTLILDALTNAPNYIGGTDTSDAIIVGRLGSGTLTLRNGTPVNVARGVIRLGNGTAGNGTLNVESGASITASNQGDILVGAESAGELNARTGAQISVGSIFVSFGAGAASLLAENPGTRITATAVNFYPGASVTLRDGATLTTSGPFTNQVDVQAGSSLTLDNATIDASTDVRIEAGATFSMTGGTIHADHFNIDQSVAISGDVDAKPVSGSVLSSITAIGDLMLGDGSATGYTGVPLNVGAFRVELRDSNAAVLNNTTINGGQLASATSLLLNTGATLSGTGTISGNIANNGLISATGASGLTFNGIISGIGQGIGGTKFTFNSGGGFTGAGTINSKIAGLAGSRLTITGSSVLGDGTILGFDNSGELDIIAGTCTLNDTNGAGPGALTTLRTGATLACPSAINLGSTPTLDVLQGNGNIISAVNNAGVISPGIAGDDETGVLMFTGDLANFSGAVRGRIDIDVLSTSDLDGMFVSGNVALAGTLNLRVAGSLHPANSFIRSLIVCTGPGHFITGSFSSVLVPPGYHVEVTPAQVILHFCHADFNSSGALTVQDIFDFLAAWFATNPAADFNASGTTTVQDIFDFLSAWFAGC